MMMANTPDKLTNTKNPALIQMDYSGKHEIPIIVILYINLLLLDIFPVDMD